MKENVKNFVPIAIRWIMDMSFPPATAAMYTFLLEGLKTLPYKISPNNELLYNICQEIVEEKSVDLLDTKLLKIILDLDAVDKKKAELLVGKIMEEFRVLLDDGIEFINEFPEQISHLMGDWRSKNSSVIEQFDVDMMRGMFNLRYSSQKSALVQNINRTVYGNDFPDEIDAESGLLTVNELQNFIKYLQSGKKKAIIDLGCGEGGPGMWIAREINANYTGIDKSDVAVEMATSRISKFDLENRASVLKRDIISTGLSDNSFDAAISVDVLQMIPDLPSALKEIHRILHQGGLLLFTAWELYFPKRKVDYIPYLKESGFSIIDRVESYDWKRRHRLVYERTLDSKDEIIKEIGKRDAAMCLYGAQKNLLTLEHIKRVFIAARKK